MLRRERLGMPPQRVPEPTQRHLPARLRLVQVFGQGKGAAQAVVDAGTPRKQRLTGRNAGFAHRPVDFAPFALRAEHEVDRGAHHRPHPLREAIIAADQQVVPHANGRVGAEVGVRPRVLDPPVAHLQRPGPVGSLGSAQPRVGAFGLGQQPGRGHRHRRFDVVPRVHVAAREPRHRTGCQLCRGDGLAGLDDRLGAQHSRDLRPRHWPLPVCRGRSRCSCPAPGPEPARRCGSARAASSGPTPGTGGRAWAADGRRCGYPPRT